MILLEFLDEMASLEVKNYKFVCLREYSYQVLVRVVDLKLRTFTVRLFAYNCVGVHSEDTWQAYLCLRNNEELSMDARIANYGILTSHYLHFR